MSDDKLPLLSFKVIVGESVRVLWLRADPPESGEPYALDAIRVYPERDWRKADPPDCVVYFTPELTTYVAVAKRMATLMLRAEGLPEDAWSWLRLRELARCIESLEPWGGRKEEL